MAFSRSYKLFNCKLAATKSGRLCLTFLDNEQNISLSVTDSTGTGRLQWTPERIEQLRDAIPPIDDPKYVDAATGDWLLDTDLIIGYVAEDGTPYAYPTKILNFHEIVNTTLAGQPIAVTYCPLCASAVVFERRLGEQTLTLGNTSALYESGMVMVDAQQELGPRPIPTGTTWAATLSWAS